MTDEPDEDLPGFTDGHGKPHILEGPLEPLAKQAPGDAPEEARGGTPPDEPAPEPAPEQADELDEVEVQPSRTPIEVPAQTDEPPQAASNNQDTEPHHAPSKATHLATACGAIDRLLDGGLERDAITLVFGEGGSGKTNLALQCAREATAAGLRVAYVDTEGVSASRLEQVFKGHPLADPDKMLFFTPFTIREQEQMVAKTALLRDVGLIVVDSINMHYRLHIEDKETERQASTSMFKQLHHLTGHARKNGIPVLVTGQVYGGEDETQPFARRIMEHMVKALVRFQKKPDGSRKATILKHRSIEEGRTARFRIGAHGLE